MPLFRLGSLYGRSVRKLEGSDNTLSAQFGCIMFHPSCYGGGVKLTPTVKNKLSSGWANNWFYCQVPAQKMKVQGKGFYLLRSEMSALYYLMKVPHNYAVDNANVLPSTNLDRSKREVMYRQFVESGLIVKLEHIQRLSGRLCCTYECVAVCFIAVVSMN
jgi:hypothetical protein